MDLLAIRLSSLEQSEQSEQVRNFRFSPSFFNLTLSHTACQVVVKNLLKRSKNSVKLHIQGSSPGGLGPSIFRPNLRAEGPKKSCWRPDQERNHRPSKQPPPPPAPTSPSSHLSEGLDLPPKDLNEPEKRIVYIKEKTNKIQGIHDVYFSHKPLF